MSVVMVRKTPDVEEAIQYTGLNSDEVGKFVGEGESYLNYKNQVIIRTLGRTLEADPGDWIIKDVNNRFHVRSTDIFEMIYDILED